MKLDQSKIERPKEILKAGTKPEAVEKALDLVISKDSTTIKRNEIMKSILSRRDRIMVIKGDVSDWIREGSADYSDCAD